MSKLSNYGIQKPLLTWIKWSLVDGTLITKLNGLISKEHIVSSDIPQGSRLEPLPFVDTLTIQIKTSLQQFFLITSKLFDIFFLCFNKKKIIEKMLSNNI